MRLYFPDFLYIFGGEGVILPGSHEDVGIFSHLLLQAVHRLVITQIPRQEDKPQGVNVRPRDAEERRPGAVGLNGNHGRPSFLGRVVRRLLMSIHQGSQLSRSMRLEENAGGQVQAEFIIEQEDGA